MARESFDTIFNVYPDGSLEPKLRIRVGGIELGPGVRFSKGASFAGIDFTLFVGRYLDVDYEGGVAVIKGIYQ